MPSAFSRTDLQRVRQLAEALSAAERGEPTPRATRPVGRSVVGIVGPPGVGKSSVISELAALSRGRGESVAVLAVDPTSPLTGGALLGDRVRMAAHSEDPLVFVRSFASRGHPGGLAEAIPAAVDAALALGWDQVFVEPVGGGQNDIAIASCADVVVLLVSPESGDEIQALKAGVLEIADIIVINKADRPGASSLLRVLESAGSPPDRPRCMLMSVTDGLGIKELDLALQSPRAKPGRGRDAAHLAMVMDDLVGQARASLRGPKVRADVLRLIRSGQRSAAVRRVVEELTLG
jgi:LAO/AO transport system kinase